MQESANCLRDRASSPWLPLPCTSIRTRSPFLLVEALVFVMLKLRQHAVQSARCIQAQNRGEWKTDTVSDIAGSFGFASLACFLSLNNH